MSIASQHTPAPWEARREFASLCIVDDAGDYIADIHDRETYDENLEVEDEAASHAEAEANARLIAAAPELLEALDNLERYLRDTPHHNAVESAAARAAIAKAISQ